MPAAAGRWLIVQLAVELVVLSLLRLPGFFCAGHAPLSVPRCFSRFFGLLSWRVTRCAASCKAAQLAVRGRAVQPAQCWNKTAALIKLSDRFGGAAPEG